MTEFPATADVAIVGGGVIGLAIARSLKLHSAGRIVLIERGSLGGESSSAAAGMLAPQAEADEPDDLFQFACASRDLYPSFASALREETGIDVELDTTGTLYLAFTDHDVQELEGRSAWQTRAGLAVHPLTNDDAKRLEPAISDRVQMALSFPFDAQVENRRLIAALAAANERLGVYLLTETSASTLRFDHNKLIGIETSRGFIATEHVVIAGGAWSSHLKTDKAIPDPSIEPVRGQMLCFESNPQIISHVIYSPRGYVVPRRDGRILAGSTTEHAGYDKRVTASGMNSITAAALEISPRFESLAMTASWAGLRPRAADGLPVLGPCAEIEGVFYATGHYRNGILLAPITAEVIAGAIINKVISPALNVFSPDRFNLATVR